MADTLIRSVLHMDPDKLSDQEWAHRVRMSEWALAVMQAGKIG
ncbi:hypothetical protein NXX78_04680 [Bacteroides fragilis]|nr:hypothetical protein [Bacteroides fragilis]